MAFLMVLQYQDTIGNIPVVVKKYAIKIKTTGKNTNGTNNNVFNIHGIPKTTGSLILTIEGIVATFPKVLYLLLFAKRSIQITKPIVAPAPPGEETALIH